MYLKSLELHGFKSFADKTRFELGEGITAVVGPNGAGKSNLADAVLWVLGEQSMRALRSNSQRDVIFAGSNGRRSLNLAEVSLTLDNADGALGIDFAEVTVSRRIYRSGESEYLINKAKCRLRDVQELFMDTGIGRHAYSIVTQGEIDAILSIRSEDRRELLEEVAGVQKYRQRRRETLRKLEVTEGNITRLADICHELASQRIPLAEQAEQARKYRELSAQLAELELDLFVADYVRHRERLGRLLHDEQVLQADLGSARAGISKLDNEEEKLKREVERLTGETRELRDGINRAESLAQQEDSAQALCDERRRSIQARRESLTQRVQTASERLERHADQLKALQGEREALEADAAEARQQVARAEAALEQLRTQLESAGREADEVRERRMSLAGDAVAAQSEKESLEAREEEIRGRLERIAAALERARERQDTLGKALLDAEQRLANSEADTRRLEAVAQEDRAAFAGAQRLATEQDTKRTIMERRASSAASRVQALEEVVESVVGAESGVQAVLEAARSGRLKGIHGTVGELITVHEKHELAIEVALGERLQWVVTDSHEDALAAIAHLRDTDAGRATFLPLGALGSVTIPASAALAGAEDGVIGVADRLVKAHRQYRRLLQFLLGDVIVTADWDCATRLYRRHYASAKLVTLAGERLERGGIVAGGSCREKRVAGVSRQQEIAALREELDALAPALERMQKVSEACHVELSRLAEALTEDDAEIASVKATSGEARRDVAHLRDQLADVDETLEGLAREQQALQERLRQTKQGQQQKSEQARTLQGEADGLAAEVADAEGRAARAQQEVDLASAQVTALSVTLAEAEEKLRSCESATQRTQEAHDEVGAEAQRDQAELSSLDDEEAQAGAEHSEHAGEAERLRAAAGKLRETLDEREGVAHQVREQLEGLSLGRRNLAATMDGYRDRLHQAELSRAREEAQMAHIEERLRDAYDVTTDEALRGRSPDIDRDAVASEVRRLKSEIRAMGNVNVGAVEEYERIKAREDFLNAQRADLDKGRADLLAIITEIDEATKAAFMDAFQAVAQAFDDIFRRLFDGGSTQLVLTDPENLLETGVEVIVQMPGKKLQNLLLLSGGERALTATALLFAMLRVRPSPFCVVDEIDAPLDDINVDRFVRVLRDLATQSQFIVITHNKRTMEAANRLVGVTMQEPGISQMIAVELEDAIEQAERSRVRA